MPLTEGLPYNFRSWCSLCRHYPAICCLATVCGHSSQQLMSSLDVTFALPTCHHGDG